MKEAILYEELNEKRVRCNVCLRRCVISPDDRGYCRTRINRGGKLFTIIYDRISAAHLDPIEKKPLYHFHPGTQVFSLGSLGCSFSCPGCQNWEISQRTPLENDLSLIRMSPSEAVIQAIRLDAAGICWTYNEPAIWLEHTSEAAREAKEKGLYTVYVTNGTATREHLDIIGPYLDAYRVDIKAFSSKGYKSIADFPAYQLILEGVQYALDRWGMHIECVTNVTPTINDSEEELRGIASWIAAKLGVDVPWHVTKFYPQSELSHLPPTDDQLDLAYQIGREEGLRFIYVGNVPNDRRQNTSCPNCGAILIKRSGFMSGEIKITGGACANCRTKIYGRWDS